MPVARKPELEQQEIVTTPTAIRMRGDFIYPATSEERAAADLLLSRGWQVTEPTCPKCQGRGVLMVRRNGRWRIGDERCPNGCWTLDEQFEWGEALDRARG